jgi:SAM-dependent methyltransferase
MDDRRAFYDSRAPHRPRELKRHYHQLLRGYYRFLVPPGLRVLEYGSGIGDLLASVEPSVGVGLDVSPAMIAAARDRHPDLRFEEGEALTFDAGQQFDYLLASDLVNDLPDVQAFFERAHVHAHSGTRFVINAFNNLWRPVLEVAARSNLKSPNLLQNWLSLADLKHLLYLAGWEVVRTDPRILWPVTTPLLGALLNRWFAPLLKPLCLTLFVVARPRPSPTPRLLSCSVVVPARNEAGNIEALVERIPEMGSWTEILFIEGGSTDSTWDEIVRVAGHHPERRIRYLKQKSAGKGGAVREAFAVAEGDLLLILDADMTVAAEELPKFYAAISSGLADFVNGVRLVYPMEAEAMQWLNMAGNKFFSLAFTWLLGQPIKDTLCGTKVLLRSQYELIARNRAYFGDFDPFGDFDLLFGAAKLNMRIVDLPVRYRARTYGQTNISRWRHGWLLLRMTAFAARRLKFIR